MSKLDHDPQNDIDSALVYLINSLTNNQTPSVSALAQFLPFFNNPRVKIPDLSSLLLTETSPKVISDWLLFSDKVFNSELKIQLHLCLLKKNEFNSYPLPSKKDLLKSLILKLSETEPTEENFKTLLKAIKKDRLELKSVISFPEIYLAFKNLIWKYNLLPQLSDIYFSKSITLKENPLYSPLIQNDPIYSELKQDSRLKKDLFLYYNLNDQVFPPEPLLSESHSLFNEYASWKRCLTINQLSLAIFGVNQKRFRKLLTKHMTIQEEKSNKTYLNEDAWLFFFFSLKAIGSLDCCFHYLRDLPSIKLDNFARQKIIKLLTDFDLALIHPCLRKSHKVFLNFFLYSNLEIKDKEELFIELIRSWRFPLTNYSLLFKDLSAKSLTHLIRLTNNILSKQNFPLPSQQNLIEFNGSSCLDAVISIPRYHYDLLFIGEDLHLCVSYGNYSKKIINNKSNLLTLKIGAQVYALVEIQYITEWQIIQAKKMFNVELEDTYKNQILSLLNSSHLT